MRQVQESGAFKGETLGETFGKSTYDDLELFFQFVYDFPGKYLAKTWRFSEVYVNWLINNARMSNESFTNLLLSEKMFDDLVRSDTAYFVPDASLFGKSQNVAFYNAGLEEYRYERNGKPQVIEVMKVLEKDGDRSFLVLNDRANPLIIKMDIDWVIWLKEVNHLWQN